MTPGAAAPLAWLLALALAAGACGSAPPAPGPAPRPPAAPAVRAPAAPEWRPGDRWTYEWTIGADTGTKTAEMVETREINGVPYYVVRFTDADHYYTRELHWAAAAREGRVAARIVPPQPWFMWPLEAGRRWEFRGTFEAQGGSTAHEDTFAVVGIEPVEVPAGRYQAIKVVRQTNRRDFDEYWYVPEVRWYVRWVGRRGDQQFEERLREYQAAPRLIPRQ